MPVRLWTQFHSLLTHSSSFLDRTQRKQTTTHPLSLPQKTHGKSPRPTLEIPVHLKTKVFSSVTSTTLWLPCYTNPPQPTFNRATATSSPPSSQGRPFEFRRGICFSSARGLHFSGSDTGAQRGMRSTLLGNACIWLRQGRKCTTGVWLKKQSWKRDSERLRVVSRIQLAWEYSRWAWKRSF